LYTGPWDAEEGRVTFRWAPGAAPSEQVALAVRFLAPIRTDDPNFQIRSYRGRPAPVCDDRGTFVFDPDLEDELPTHLLGDPNRRLVEVSCLLADDGEFTLERSMLGDALAYLRSYPAAGAVLLFSRGTITEAPVPAAKDPYDQRREISPVKIVARDVRVGRFRWEGPTTAAPPSAAASEARSPWPGPPLAPRPLVVGPAGGAR
jgi:hypothetical protein